MLEGGLQLNTFTVYLRYYKVFHFSSPVSAFNL